jgi:hypothetical protein
MERIDQIVDKILQVTKQDPNCYQIVELSNNEANLFIRTHLGKIVIRRKGDVFSFVEPAIGTPVKSTLMVEGLKKLFETALNTTLDSLEKVLDYDLKKLRESKGKHE